MEPLDIAFLGTLSCHDNFIDLSLSRCFVIRDDKIVMTGSLNCGGVAVN